MTVVFEILSPGNTQAEMTAKHDFYEQYGVEEYYIFDPDRNHLQAWIRNGTVLLRVRKVKGYVSPRLGIRFDFSGPEMVILYPDRKPFLTLVELDALRLQAEQRADRAEEALRRIVQLSRMVRLQQASPDEIAELERLESKLH